MDTSPKVSLRLRVTAAAEREVRRDHPWVYSDSVRECNRPGQVGELAVIFDRKNKFLAIGLFDPNSPIQVRILHHGKPCLVDEGWWRQNLQKALLARSGLFDSDTTGYRVINGESDGWPALVLDRYGSTYALKLYSLAWLQRLELLQSLLVEALSPERIVLRLSRNIQEASQTQYEKADGNILYGPPVEDVCTFLESGIRFEVDVIRGQKTGFFLDQRENRQRIGQLSEGCRVLNAFSFSGGFSLYAARGGATSVTDLDISTHALEGAKRNFQLNRQDRRAGECQHEMIQADVFKWLARKPDREFDVIILDPPSLARKESERHGAVAAYRRLVGDAICWLSREGVLFAGSCSAHVSAKEFFDTVRETARESGRSFQEIETTGHAPDHPATFQEASYLKGIYLGFLRNKRNQ